MRPLSVKIGDAILSTLFHGAMLCVVAVLTIFALFGANAVDATITDYTGHQLLKVIFDLISIILPSYIIMNWVFSMVRIFRKDIIKVTDRTNAFLGVFVRGGINAVRKQKKDTL